MSTLPRSHRSAELRRVLRAAATGFLDFVYPPRCVGCGRYGRWLCDDCLATVPHLTEPRRLELQGGATLPVWSIGPHAGVLRTAVHALKYEDVRVLAVPLAAMLADVWLQAGLQGDAIVPVPLHRRRLRERGFNQSQLLAQALGTEVNVPVRWRALVRVRETPVQVGSSAEERRANVAGAFVAAKETRGVSVVIIDDVCTSGATIEACAAAIVAAGGRPAAAMTVTQAQLSEPGV